MEHSDTSVLNKKLASWAGLHPRERSDGHTIQRIDQPNFTEDLTACFRWLVPKLKPNYEVALHTEPQLTWECTLWAMQKGLPDAVSIEAETPALALCLAMEKLIDEKDSTSSLLEM